jgi:hypothetical protein
VVTAGTCVCSSGVTWGSCDNGIACYRFCNRHGGVRFWGGPGRIEDLYLILVLTFTVCGIFFGQHA